MDLDFAVLADGVMDRGDGKLDIYGAGFDTIFATAVPALHRRLVLVARVLISAHEGASPHRLQVVIQAADGQEIARAQGSVDPVPPEQRAQIPAGRQVGIGLIINFDNVILPQYGSYQIAMLWDTIEARPPLRLFVAETPQPSP